MITKKKQEQLLLFIIIFVLGKITFFIPTTNAQVNHHECRQTCGSSKPVPYPFGFSSGCAIRLKCTAGVASVGEFPVKVNTDSMIVSIEAQCNRPFDSLHHLFSHKYAPTSRNVILLENCTGTPLPCFIPETLVRTHFESVGCNNASGTGELSCYFENRTNGFVDRRTLDEIGCKYFMSSLAAPDIKNISGAPLSLDVNIIQLGWWLQGDQCLCSDHANCTTLQSPMDGKPGFRCRCRDGFVGDGFLAGTGCRKASSCNPAKYISGRCGGTTRFIVLIGGFVVGVSLMVTLGSLCCFYRRRSKLRVTNSTKRRLTEATGKNSVPIYPYKDIEKATNSFSEKQRLGTGAYGTVYAGKLYNNEWVAIKRIKHRDTDSIEQVMNEIKLLSSVSHTNLVRLLGCSIEYGEQILVYEFMPNGTLSQHLQKERGSGLPWPIRLTIATETAQAIAYLHSAICPPIYHRDIKSSNILLDYNFRHESKVADFGLSRLGMTEISHISTTPQGTPGYIGKGLLNEIIDPFLEPEVRSDAWTLSSIHKVAELAFRCIAFHRDMRPSMTEVASELEQLRLSRWTTLGDNNCATSTELSSCSSSSNECEKPLSIATRNFGAKGKGHLKLQTGPINLKSLQRPNSNSPVSVQDQDLWLSEQSSPSSSSFPSKSFD
ncbi:hypothetical protein JHK87_014175 [Glycine soja]|nr:hypothetical protein JHK87_014175 [Glycine soja]